MSNEEKGYHSTLRFKPSPTIDSRPREIGFVTYDPKNHMNLTIKTGEGYGAAICLSGAEMRTFRDRLIEIYPLEEKSPGRYGAALPDFDLELSLRLEGIERKLEDLQAEKEEMEAQLAYVEERLDTLDSWRDNIRNA